jgi:hypothetical protein
MEQSSGSKGILLPDLGMVFFYLDNGEECVRPATAEDGSAAPAGGFGGGGGGAAPCAAGDADEAVKRAREFVWPRATMPVRELPENLRAAIGISLADRGGGGGGGGGGGMPRSGRG